MIIICGQWLARLVVFSLAWPILNLAAAAYFACRSRPMATQLVASALASWLVIPMIVERVIHAQDPGIPMVAAAAYAFVGIGECLAVFIVAEHC